MRLPAAILAAGAALALGACGQASTAGKFTGQKETVATVIEDLQRDGQRKKADDICEKLLTQELQDKVKAGSATCAAEMKKALDDADAFDLEVQTVTINGTTASARVKGKDEGDGVIRTLDLEKVGDSWRIASFGTS
jgi:hypothetical protein